ncbi:MAG: hypothetical protein EOP62_14305 [Sphingomonadales bacterium]|nr:MAG: hypothetical protein EOP62_14305 [Sphingomonadales bacterium]
MTFATLFDFKRPHVADYRNANGAIVTAAIDAPRFDHDLAGSPIGLVVEPGPDLGQHDRVSLAAAIAIDGPATVFQAITLPDGSTLRRAVYTRDVTATVNALLRVAGRHQAIGAVGGFIAIRNGAVRYRGKSWTPPAVIAADAALLAGGHDRPMLAN